jgi:hypothetical protein
MDVNSGSSGQAYIVHHRTDEFLIKQHAISDGQATSPIKNGAQQDMSSSPMLSSYSANSI